MKHALSRFPILFGLPQHALRNSAGTLLRPVSGCAETNSIRYYQQETKPDKHNRLQVGKRVYKRIYTVIDATSGACFIAGVKQVTKAWLGVFMS